ncbi:GT2 family glycosyltransferase [Ilumatobacter fluminis]|uniref:GT2 family glycosyltransferase n=1 Tax=Ilumatobacter fluminis TaxID=467091 RepID=A0A4R7I651_9ACTN|nr:GT2 family glycosyltransferase [Ilumatobacter fluminis]
MGAGRVWARHGRSRWSRVTAIRAVCVAVATYRRPDGLDALLSSIEQATAGVPVRVVVVDNDPVGSAKFVADRHAIVARYEIEATPGIAAARNRCLELVEVHEDAIVFVDDDERVSTEWLAALLQAARDYGADIVGGPVVSELPDGVGPWARLHQRRIEPDGSRSGLPATNNALVRTSLLRKAGAPKFDPSFSVSGGSDTDFFWRLKEDHGAHIVWSDTALVYEDVPPERTTLRWLCRRSYRNGAIIARVELRRRGRVLVLARGVARCLRAILRVLGSLIRMQDPWRPLAVDLPRGLGVCGACFGVAVVAYTRQSGTNEATSDD